MKDLRTNLKNPLALFGLAVGCMLFTTGCFSTEAGAGASADVAGVLQGDAESAGALGKSAVEVDGAVVTAHEIMTDGSLGPVVAQSETDAEGSFVLKTDLKGKRKLIVRAIREGKEWKARLEDDFREGSSHWVRPLNLESSLEADVWIELQKTAPGRSVYSHEASASVDAEVAVSVHAVYRGADSTARAQLVTRLARVTRAASQARAGAMSSVAVRVEAAAEKSREAEAAFRARLHEVKRDTAEIRKARVAFLRAVADAHVQAEVKATTYARACEAGYRAAARAADSLSDSARAAFSRNSARMLAIASDIALQAQFRAAGATEAQVNNVAEAGARFMLEVDAAVSKDACDSAMTHYRDEARESFDSAFTSLAVAVQSIATAMDSLSAALELEAGATAGDSETGEAYMNAQVQASAHIQAALSQMEDEAKAEAVADAVAFLSVRPRN